MTHISKILRVVVLLILGSALARGQGAQISVAAAADLTFALNDIAKEYESQTHNIGKNCLWIERKFLFADSEWRAVFRCISLRRYGVPA